MQSNFEKHWYGWHSRRVIFLSLSYCLRSQGYTVIGPLPVMWEVLTDPRPNQLDKGVRIWLKSGQSEFLTHESGIKTKRFHSWLTLSNKEEIQILDQHGGFSPLVDWVSREIVESLGEGKRNNPWVPHGSSFSDSSLLLRLNCFCPQVLWTYACIFNVRWFLFLATKIVLFNKRTVNKRGTYLFCYEDKERIWRIWRGSEPGV